jgi:hypothetical protein
MGMAAASKRYGNATLMGVSCRFLWKPVGDRISRAIRPPPTLLIFEHNHWDCRFVFFWYSLKKGYSPVIFCQIWSRSFPVATRARPPETVVRHLHFDYRISAQVQVPVRVSISAAFRPNHYVGIPGSSVQHG